MYGGDIVLASTAAGSPARLVQQGQSKPGGI